MVSEKEMWFFEKALNIGTGFKFNNCIYTTESKYQKIGVYESKAFGRVLVLDGIIQLTEADEHVYHEMLVHPAFLYTKAKRVVVFGGGDLCAAREILKYDFVNEVHVCEIDEEVIKVIKEFFPRLVKGVMNDKRLKIIIMDGAKYIKSMPPKDIILIDSSEPISYSRNITNLKFYEECILKSRTLVYQGGCAYFKHHVPKANSKSIVKYVAPIPSYPTGMWSFVLVTGDKLHDDNKIPNTRFFSTEIFHQMVKLYDIVQSVRDNFKDLA